MTWVLCIACGLTVLSKTIEGIDDEDEAECEYPEWFSEVHITNHLQRKRPAGHQQPIAS